MNSKKRIICVTALEDDSYHTFVEAFLGAEVIRAHDLETIRNFGSRNAVLVCFGTGQIIPEDILALYDSTFNIHAAPPEFPGRDPHHHAVYAGCESYGATLHYMEAAVDAGPIIDVERFVVPANCTPEELLGLANEAGMRLVQRHGAAIARGMRLPRSSEVWSGEKTRRRDLLRLSRVDRFTGPEDLIRRYRAFDGGPYNNLTTELFGLTFRIEKAPQKPIVENSEWSEFTEQGYRAILRALIEGGYVFSSYHSRPKERHVIWRHDVDFSMQRALWCAREEQAAGVFGTYFINPRSTFYNLAEPESLRCLNIIADLGHEIGLHFDGGASGVSRWTASQLEDAVTRERGLFEAITGYAVRAVSWHNPDLSNLLDFDSEQVGGLTNAYSRSLRRDYTYCSDSNGYWRYSPMLQIIAQGSEKLHFLTHPGWWTPMPSPPRARVERAVAGRAAAVMADYDRLLERAGRANRRS